MKKLLSAAVIALLIMGMSERGSGQEVDRKPEWAHNWYFSLWLADPPTKRGLEIQEFLETNPVAQNFLRQISFYEFDDASPLVTKTVWGDVLGDKRPAVLLQAVAKSDGSADVVYFGNEEVRPSVEWLLEIQAAINSYVKDREIRPLRPRQPGCPGPFCPLRPEPEPAPDPEPKPAPEPAPRPAPQPLLPTIVEPEEPEEVDEPTEGNDSIPIYAFLFPVIGASAGLYKSIREEEG